MRKRGKYLMKGLGQLVSFLGGKKIISSTSMRETPEEFERNMKKEFKRFMRKLRREEIRAEKTGNWRKYERMMPCPQFCPSMYSYDVLYQLWLFH